MPGSCARSPATPTWSAGVLLLVIGAVAQPPPAMAAELPWPVSSRTLENGLEVHVVPMPTPGVVAWQAWVAVGSGQEVEVGRTGFAHFFEHLMFFGTEELPLDARERALLRMGVEENAWTWVDETVYHALLPASQLDAWSKLEAGRFRRLALTPDDVRREAGAVYGEFRKGRADPAGQLYETLMATAFEVHPYRHDTIGYEADIAAMPEAYDDAMRFFTTWYRPQHTIVVVAGDVDPEAVHALVERDWGGWERGDIPTPEIPVEPEQAGIRRVELPWSGPTAPRLVMAWKIPAEDPDSPDLAALQLAADLLLAPEGPLQRTLVHEEGLVYQVSGGRDRWAAPGLFRVELVLTDPAHLERAEQVVREAIADLDDTPQPALERTRSRARYGLLTSLDDPQIVAGTVGEAVRLGGSPDAVTRSLARYDAVGVEDLQRVTARYLVDDRLTVAVLRPTAEAE